MNKEELKYSYLEYSLNVTNEIFDEIILKLKDLGFIEFSTNNGYANFSKDGDSKLILSPNFEYYVSDGDMYDRTRLKVSDILGEETKFEVGKWYSFYWNWSSGYNCIGKVCRVNTYEKTVIQFDNYTSNNSPGKLFTDGRTIYLAEIENIKELNLEEIQQYLPDDHPDKIVKEFTLPAKWCIKVDENKKPVEVFKWRISSVDGGNKGGWNDKGFINNKKHHDYIKLEGYTEITLDQFKQYVLGEPIKKEVKTIEKWSVGSYVVFLQRYGNSNKGTIDVIKEFDYNSSASFLEKEGGSPGYLDRELNNYLKWFATLSEAEAFSKSLLEPEKEDLNKYDSEGNLIKMKKYVKCDTQEQWDFVKTKYNQNTCSSLFYENRYIDLTLPGNSYYNHELTEPYKLYTFQEWLDLNGYTFEEGISNKFNVGDEVKVCSKSEDLKGHGFLDSLRDKVSPINGVAGSTGIIESFKEYAGTIYYELDRFAPNGYISEDCLKLIKSCVVPKEPKEMQLSDLKNPIFNVGDRVKVIADSLREFNSSWTRGNNTRYKEGYIGIVSNVTNSSKKEINTWCYLEDHSSAISCNLLELVESSESSKPKKIDRNVYYEVETQEQYNEVLDWLESNGEQVDKGYGVIDPWKYICFENDKWCLNKKVESQLSKAEFQFKGKSEKQPIKTGGGLRDLILQNQYQYEYKTIDSSSVWETLMNPPTQNSTINLKQEPIKLLSFEEDDVVLFKTNSVKISNKQLIIND